MAALALVVPIVQVIITHHILLLANSLSTRPLLTFITVCCELGVYASYAALLRNDAGFLPGGTPAHATQYWAALEASGALPTQFDPRAELLRPPRSGYSTLAAGLVLEFDHDCPWIGGPVGKGNHVPFIALLVLGDAALLLHVATCLTVQPWGVTSTAWHRAWMREMGSAIADNIIGAHGVYAAITDAFGGAAADSVAPPPPPPLPTDEAVLVRVLCLSEVLALCLVCLITGLLVAQLLFIVQNVLTVECLRWQRAHPGMRTPKRGEPAWAEYAPYDLGSARRNLVAFVRGTRSSYTAAESKEV